VPIRGQVDDAAANGEDASSGQLAGPLQGIRVLDVSTVYAAPSTAMMLGDYGADGVKVEHPRVDPARTQVTARADMAWGGR
jgi:crotonobetainyl-CoA:carnitine CoA-transferase CaiB-like acyl-CoA transferase